MSTQGGIKVCHVEKIIGVLLVAVLAGAFFVVSAPEVKAGSTIEERRVEREARRAERDADENAEETGCDCSARLDLARPSLQWRGYGLQFVPRVDVSIRTRGETGGPAWAVKVLYDGVASFGSDDVTVPKNMNFRGGREVAGGQCGDNRYSYSGLALAPVNFAELKRMMLGDREELTGFVLMQARLEGCDFNEEKQSFRFMMKEFGDLRVRGWRSAR